MSSTYYSVMQFFPDLGRFEAVNVGVVVMNEDASELRVRTTQELPGVGKCFGLDAWRVACAISAAKSMEIRLLGERFKSMAEFEHFLRSRGNDIQFTVPSWMRAENLDEAVNSLFDEVVTRPDRSNVETSGRRVPPQLQALFARLGEQHPDRTRVKPRLSTMHAGLEIKADYAFKNGIWNIVKAERIPSKTKDIDKLALRLHALGELIHCDVSNYEDAQLIVVGAPATAERREAEQHITTLLQGLAAGTHTASTSFVPFAEIDQFVRQVERDVTGIEPQD
jgi:hypothetical protein